MSIRLDRVRDLYLRGIRDGDTTAVDDNSGATYIQHSGGVPTGPEGFKAFFADFVTRHPERDIRLVRAFEDPDGVFVHAHQILDGGAVQWVTMDWFRFDDEDRILEHWDCITEHSAANPSGRSNVDGPTEVTDDGRGQANAELVTTALMDLWGEGGDRQAGLAVIAEDLVQHSAEMGDGRQVLADMVTADPPRLVYSRIHRVCAAGNMVACLSEATRDGAPYAQADLLRVEDGVIVEHWDVPEAIAPREEWANDGKF